MGLGHLKNITTESCAVLGEQLASSRQRPVSTRRVLEGRPNLSGALSIFKGKYLDSALEGVKPVKKHRQAANHGEET